MSAPRRSVLVAVALGVAMLLGACTSSRLTNAKQIDAPSTTSFPHYANDAAGITASLTAHLASVGPNLNQWAPSDSEAKCVATKVVDRLGVPRLLELGFDTRKGSLNLPYSATEQASVVNVMVGCIDFQEAIIELLTAYQKLDLTPSACLGAGVTQLGLDRDMATSVLEGKQMDLFANDDQIALAFSKLMIQCLDPNKDLPPLGPQSPFPQDTAASNTTTTTTGG